MPDNIMPVGLGTQPPDPLKGINTFSGILGIKQQQIGLQQQAQRLQTETAQAQQATLQTGQLQDLSLFTKGAMQSDKYRLPNGDPDVQSFTRDALQIAPTQASLVGQMASNFKEAVSTRQSLQSLSEAQNSQIAKAMQGIATNPNATSSDLLDAVRQLRSNNKDPGLDRALDNFLLGASRTSPQQAAANAASILGGVAQTTPAQMDIGGQIATGAQRVTGPGIGTFNPTGQIFQKTLNPAQTPGYLAQAGAATGSAGVDVQRFSGVTNAAATAQTGVALADQVADLAKEVRTGELSKEWADKLTVLKQTDPTITARQMLAKYAAQLKTTATNGAATDAERAQIDAGMPSPETMNPDAVRDAAQYLHGYFRMNQARGQNALQHVGSTGSASGLTQADTAFMQTKDPFVYAFKDMPREQQKEFLIKRYGPGGNKDPQGFAQFEQRVKGTQ